MIAMSIMGVHYACHPGSGMFVRLTRMLIRILMGVSVIHVVVLLLRRREFECFYHADVITDIGRTIGDIFADGRLSPERAMYSDRPLLLLFVLLLARSVIGMVHALPAALHLLHARHLPHHAVTLRAHAHHAATAGAPPHLVRGGRLIRCRRRRRFRGQI